jgi:hypothetical protein
MILKIAKFSKKKRRSKISQIYPRKKHIHIVEKKQQNLSKTIKKTTPTPHTHENSKK